MKRGLAVEMRDAPAARLGLTMAALIGTVLLLCAAVAGLMHWFDRDAPPIGAPASRQPPEPRLQVREPDQRHAIEGAATAALAHRPGRIGINEAMRRTVAAGWEEER